MNYEEFTNLFQSHVYRLTYQKQFEIAIAICKKLFSDYKVYSLENNWGEPDILLDAIKLCQFSYNKKNDNSEPLRAMMNIVNNITPDTEDFENASYALNACTAIHETLEVLIDKDGKHILNVGSYLTDTIYFKIQEEGELTETQINNHPEIIEVRKFLLEH